MTNYMKDTAMVVQNLKDAGCDGDTVKQFIALAETGEKQGQFKLLEKHRSELLDKVHKSEKQIDCLDYLIYQMRKAST